MCIISGSNLIAAIGAVAAAGQLATPTVPEAPGSPGWTDELAGEATRLVRDLMADQRIPGLSVSVVLGGELVWEAGFGKADLENDVPATEKTVYRLGSVSKPVTAVAAMKLAEDGVLDLDQPVGELVAAWPEGHPPTSSRQLLGHLGGVRHYRPLEAQRTTHYMGLERALAIFKDDDLLHEPGSKYRYSTYGYTLLGCAMEEAAGGREFMEVLRDTVTVPAGAATMRDDQIAAIIPHRAQGYVDAGGGEYFNSTLADTSYKIPGGGLCATAGDVGRFAAALMNGELISSASMEEMWTEQAAADGEMTGYGLGWNVGEWEGKREVWHGGAQQRVRTFLCLVPEDKTAVTILCNLERTRLPETAWAIVRATRGERGWTPEGDAE